MTVVYIDSVFILNAVMDYLLLLAVGRLAGIPRFVILNLFQDFMSFHASPLSFHGFNSMSILRVWCKGCFLMVAPEINCNR